MKTTTALLVILAIIICVPASAAEPPIINYQGKLLQPSGAPFADGTYSVQFAIYSAPTGGTPLLSETNTAVQVKGGLFAVLLGSVNNLGPNIFDQPNRFFGVKVGSDPEMTPRQQIASVAYAVKAASADIAATVSDGAITSAKMGPQEAWHEIGSANEPSFENGWVNYGTVDDSAKFMKDSLGFVHVIGLVRGGPVGVGNDKRVFTLPVGYRPAKYLHFATTANAMFAEMRIDGDGSVQPEVGSSVWYSLNAIFKAEQ